MTAVESDLPPLVLDASWWSFAGPHGGHLAGHLLAATARLTDHPVRSLHVQFPATAVEGPVDVEARLVRQGRSTAFATASMTSGGATAARASVVFGALRPGPRVEGPKPPQVEPPDDVPILEFPPGYVPFTQYFEYRPSPQTPPFQQGPADLFGWVRYRDDRPVDEVAATVLVDALPPGLYGALTGPVPIPSADLYVQFFAGEPVTGWTLGQMTTLWAGHGWCVDDSHVWSMDGRLIASARQTRLVLGGEL